MTSPNEAPADIETTGKIIDLMSALKESLGIVEAPAQAARLREREKDEGVDELIQAVATAARSDNMAEQEVAADELHEYIASIRAPRWPEPGAPAPAIKPPLGERRLPVEQQDVYEAVALAIVQVRMEMTCTREGDAAINTFCNHLLSKIESTLTTKSHTPADGGPSV